MNTDRKFDRLDELLALEATQGLTPAEATELDALLAAFPNEDPDALERAAAAVHLALCGPIEPLPARLAEKLELGAVAFIPTPRPAHPRHLGRALATWGGWAVAACLAGVLVFTYWPKKEPTVQEARDAFVRNSVAKPVPFTGEKGTATGDVVWSTDKQEGYLEVRGLPALDPTKEQYQLWIVDPSKKQPVDAGVFDVKPDGTALVRVRTPILVKDAKAFAITKETAGGVVVSDGPHVLVLTPRQG